MKGHICYMYLLRQQPLRRDDYTIYQTHTNILWMQSIDQVIALKASSFNPIDIPYSQYFRYNRFIHSIFFWFKRMSSNKSIMSSLLGEPLTLGIIFFYFNSIHFVWICFWMNNVWIIEWLSHELMSLISGLDMFINVFIVTF